MYNSINWETKKFTVYAMGNQKIHVTHLRYSFYCSDLEANLHLSEVCLYLESMD